MALTRRPCDYLVIEKTKDGVLGFYVLEKWIESFFVGDSCSRTMSWIDIVVWQGEELGLNTMKELFHTTSWQVCPTNGFSEKGISR